MMALGIREELVKSLLPLKIMRQRQLQNMTELKLMVDQCILNLKGQQQKKKKQLLFNLSK